MELSIIAPCFNEQGNIDLLCRRVRDALEPLGASFELICIDDGSSDETKKAIETAQETYPFVVGAFHEKNQGIVGGWNTGCEVSRGAYLVTIDADLQYRPEDIPLLLETMKSGDVDMVQGWRNVQVKRGWLRRFLTGALSVMLNLLFGMRLHDNKSGFILYRREVLGDLLVHRFEFNHFQHFIAIAAHAAGYRIAEVPVTFDERNWGTSFIQNPLRFSLKVAPEFFKAVVAFRLRKPKSLAEG